VPGPIVVRRASGDQRQGELAGDLEKQLRTRLLASVPVSVKARQASPAGSVRQLEIGEPGNSTEDLALTTGGTYLIPHGLDGPVRGRLVVYQNANATLFDVDVASLGANVSSDRFFAVATSANCTYRLMVYR
jgi:hypothetical protein